MEKVKVYYKPGAVDCYTVAILNPKISWQVEGRWSFYAMSANPSHPQGIGMYVGCTNDGYKLGRHLGRRVNMLNLPVDVVRAIKSKLSTDKKEG